MGMIYNKAWRVLSWLGPENPSTELGIWALNNYVEFLSQPITESWINQLNAVKMLCYCKYWTRLWIIQEVLSAQKTMWCKKMKTKRMLLVFCGRKSFDLTNLYPLARATLSHTVVSDLHVLSQAKATLKEIYYSFATHLSAAYQPAKQQKNMPFGRGPLMWLTATYRASNCENLRDKIFGVRSLAMECCQKASYSLSVLRLYKILVDHCVVAHGYLGSWYKVPEVFYRVHLFLGITFENIKDNITSALLENSGRWDSTLREAFPFFATSKVRGCVKHIHTSRAGEGSESLNHTLYLYSEAVDQQLEYIQTQSTTTGRLYITSATDLVRPFGEERRAYVTIHRSRLGYRKECQSTLDSKKERLHISQHSDQAESRGPILAFDG